MRTSRPSIARCSTPSTSLFARSVPNARKRPVESSKSNGSGKRSSDIVQRLVALERNALFVQVLRQSGAREHAVCDERRAAIRPAVADEDKWTRFRQRAALAPVAAHRADALVAEDHAPAVGTNLGVVRAHLDLDALPLEHRQDQLGQAARHDDRLTALDEPVETKAHLHVLNRPRHALLLVDTQPLEIATQRLSVTIEPFLDSAI